MVRLLLSLVLLFPLSLAAQEQESDDGQLHGPTDDPGLPGLPVNDPASIEIMNGTDSSPIGTTGARTCMVQPGNTQGKIAKRLSGLTDPSHTIFAGKRHLRLISDSDSIRTGMALTTPATN